MASSTDTVSLDVGGVKHKVSRSLIDFYPDTMLARLISDRWQTNQNNQEAEDALLFIDRDGELFRHVLLYMRNKKVYLPRTIAKGNLLMELEYYGFENVPSDAIVPSQDSLLSARFLAKVRLDASKDNVGPDERKYWETRERYSSFEVEHWRIDPADARYSYKRLAQTCCDHFVQTGSLKHKDFSDETTRTLEPEILNVHLAFFGLACVSWDGEHCDGLEEFDLSIDMKIVVAPITESKTFDEHVGRMLKRYEQEVEEDRKRDFDRAYSLYMDRLREGMYGEVDAEDEHACKECESRDEALVQAKQNKALAVIARECYETFAEYHSLCYYYHWDAIDPDLLTPNKLDVHLKFFGMQCISVEEREGVVVVHFGMEMAED